MDIRVVVAVKGALSKAKVCKKTIAKYDVESRRAYLEYADGKREYKINYTFILYSLGYLLFN